MCVSHADANFPAKKKVCVNDKHNRFNTFDMFALDRSYRQHNSLFFGKERIKRKEQNLCQGWYNRGCVHYLFCVNYYNRFRILRAGGSKHGLLIFIGFLHNQAFNAQIIFTEVIYEA